jgi:hypothetical protein
MEPFKLARSAEVKQAVEEFLPLLARLDRGLLGLSEPLRELRRQSRARSKRRPSTADQAKYRLGSVLVALGFDGEAHVEILGLLWHPDVALTWLARARKKLGSVTLQELVAEILSDQDRREWFHAWGSWVLWHRRRELYQASVQSFLDSGKADDPVASWRAKPPTDDQLELIAVLTELDRVDGPEDPTRGDAFDWIRERAGNPRYRSGPPLPDHWL